MAAKVNTRFVVVVVLGLILTAAVLSVLLMLNMRGKTVRNQRLGDEAFQAADYKTAYDYYSRVVHKQPGNDEYLRKLEQSLLKLQPRTAEEAAELYNQYLSILHQGARNLRTAEANLKVLEELHRSARYFNITNRWEAMVKAADDMWRLVPESDPARPLAKTYRALAQFRLGAIRTQAEFSTPMADIEEAVAALPDDDLTWSTYVLGNLHLLEKMRTEGMTAGALRQQRVALDEVAAKAMTAVPQGAEVARIELLRLLVEDATEPDLIESSAISAAADRLDQRVRDDADPWFVGECAAALSSVPGDGYKRAVALLDRCLKAQPEAYDARMTQARLQYLLSMKETLDQAEQSAREIVAAAPLTVGFLSQLQYDLRRRAAALIVDVQYRRWEMASAEDRPTRLQAIEQARDELLNHISDPINDPYLLRSDGKIAMAKGDFSRAASCFQQLINSTGMGDSEVLAYSSYCLQAVGELGLAHERISLAVQQAPGMPNWTIQKARLEYAMGRPQDTLKTLSALPASLLADEQLKDWLSEVRARAAGDSAAVVDPALAAIDDANKAMVKGDVQAARTLLQAALQASSADVRLLIALAQLELHVGDRPAATRYVQRLKELEPNSPRLRGFELSLQIDDPVQVVREIHKTGFTTDVDRVSSLMLSFVSMHRQQQEFAQRYAAAGNVAEEQKARALAKRMFEESEVAAVELQRIAPDHPQLLEYQFAHAIQQRDWAKADQVVARVKELNVDQANGLFYKGQLELARATLQMADGQTEPARAAARAAVRSLEAASDRIGYSAAVWRELASAHHMLGDLGQAQRALEQAYRCNPNDLTAVRMFVSVLLRRNEQTRALAILRNAHRLAPLDVGLREQWLDVEAAAGDLLLAVRERRSIYSQDPADMPNAMQLAKLLFELEPTRETITDAAGVPLYSEQRWVRMTAAERDEASTKVREEWMKNSTSILDGVMARVSAQPFETPQQKFNAELRVASLRAQMLQARGAVAQGEQVLREFVGGRTGTPYTCQMLLELARYQARSNHFTEAIATYKEAIPNQDSRKCEAQTELAELLMRLSLNDEAIEQLQAVAGVAPSPVISKQLVECLTRLKRFDQAEQRLREAGVDATSDPIWLMLSASIADGRADECASRGDTAGCERQVVQQREALSRAEAADPSNASPRLLLSQSLLKEFRRTRERSLLDDALQALDRAEKIRPNLDEISFLRVHVLKEKALDSWRRTIEDLRSTDEGKRRLAEDPASVAVDFSGPIGELRRLLDRSPTNVAARRELVTLYLQGNDVQAAMQEIDEALKLHPGLAFLHEAKGDIARLHLRDYPAALAALARADELMPSSTLLFKVIDTAFMINPSDCKDILSRLERRMDDVRAMPALGEHYMRALACIGRKSEAKEQARAVFARRKELIASGAAKPSDIGQWFQPTMLLFVGTDGTLDIQAAEQFILDVCHSDPGVHELRGLARAWFVTGASGASRGLEYQRQAAAKCPADDRELSALVNLELANFLLTSRQQQEAATVYETVLSLDPDNIEALNNYAFMLAEDLKQAEKGVVLAERVAKLKPKDPEVLDTLGWAYFRANNLEKARQTLTDALTRSHNQNADLQSEGRFGAADKERTLNIQLHLAEILIASGDSAAAAREVDAAEKLSSSPSARQKIDRLRDDIGKSRTAPR